MVPVVDIAVQCVVINEYTSKRCKTKEEPQIIKTRKHETADFVYVTKGKRRENGGFESTYKSCIIEGTTEFKFGLLTVELMSRPFTCLHPRQ